jgi:hypothetical protein
MAKLISIDDLKQHLHIEQGFMDDDDYLGILIDTAQEAVENLINRKLTDCEPKTVLHAIRFLAATWYLNREGVSFGAPHEIPFTLKCLIDINRNYGGCSGITD